MLSFLIAAIAAPPTYQQDVAAILAKHCTVCHNDHSLDDPETSGGLSLESFDRVVNRKQRPIIRRENATESELLRRLTATDVKKRMPKDEAPLAAAEINSIRRWIDSGCPKGETVVAPLYQRRETRRKGVLRELIVKFDVTAPPKAFGQPSGGQLSLAARLQPATVMTALAVSPDGSRLALAGFRRVVVWNVAKVEVEYQFTDSAGMATGLAFSPDGATLYLSGGEPGLRGEVCAYRMSDGRQLFSTGLASDVLTGVAVHRDGKRVALSGMDRKVRMYDVSSQRENWSFRGHSDVAWSVAFSRDCSKLVSCGKDKSVKIWNTETGAVEQTITAHKDEVLAAVFAPDGKAVFSGGKEPQVYFTRLGQGGKAVLSGGHSIALQHFAWNAAQTKLASAGADRTVRLWKPNGSLDRVVQGAPDVVYACGLSPDGKAAYGACGDGTVVVWAVDASRIVARLFVGDPGSGASGPWLAAAGNGALAMSDDCAAHAHWIVGTQEIPLDRAPPSFRRPDSLLNAFNGTATLKSLIPPPESPRKTPTKKPDAVPKKIAAVGRERP